MKQKKNTATPQKTPHRLRLLETDQYLAPYEAILMRRQAKTLATEKRLRQNHPTLADFAGGHEYYGLHVDGREWVFREWAPNATAVFLIGEMNAWREENEFALTRIDPEGDWEIRLPADKLHHGMLYRLRIHWPGGSGDRIPVYARRVVQDPQTLIFNAQIWRPDAPYVWQTPDFRVSADFPLIYETHVGMAQPEPKIGSYREFADLILPRIVKAGYNTVQLMAVQEHPYYASFGYHVSSFFAASSRFGSPDDLKYLVDQAHAAGLAMIMDLIHSHAVNNETEGLSRFDGTLFQYFHSPPRGYHWAWDSRCFDYGKLQVLHFLLSNCRFWLDEYRFDGFRFDGVTSMLYTHHGLEKAFTNYAPYFDDTVDEDALTYLTLANQVIHEVRPDAMTIAEDISGMPGLAAPLSAGGTGFDYRLAMGMPDFWIKLVKDMRDEDWPMGHLWYELTNRRRDEKTINYTESHDQALVGDKTLMFRMADSEMYHHMQAHDPHLGVGRAMALHKLIRLITLATAGNGYLNFMGNEFGHPEWIDFPREDNGWSYHHARRQWNLLDDPNLKYRFLGDFDRAMIALAKERNLIKTPEIDLLYEHSDQKIIAFARAGLVFVFNFHAVQSYTDYAIQVPTGTYQLILDTDRPEFGGHNRLAQPQPYFPLNKNPSTHHAEIRLYLPNRTALVLAEAEGADR